MTTNPVAINPDPNNLNPEPLLPPVPLPLRRAYSTDKYVADPVVNTLIQAQGGIHTLTSAQRALAYQIIHQQYSEVPQQQQ